jgi:predicted  nucleic acid-binding Zn-ribbon protein
LEKKVSNSDEDPIVQEQLVALEELQNLDLENLNLRNELEEIPKNVEEMRADVARVGEILDRERDRLAEAEEWRRDREREIAIQTELLAKSKAKLQAARNEKENKAAQREIDTIRRTIQEREKEALEVMEASDSYRAAIDEHTKEFGELEEHLRATEEEGRKRMAEVEEALGRTDSRREQLSARVPKRLLSMYERIHKRLGKALVECIAGHCTGCNMELLPQMYIELQRGEKLINCPSCNRILVFKGS